MSVNTIPTRNQQSNEYLERNQEILQSVPIFLAHTLEWGPSLREEIFNVENVQKRATKIVQGIKDLPYEDRLRHLKLP